MKVNEKAFESFKSELLDIFKSKCIDAYEREENRIMVNYGKRSCEVDLKQLFNETRGENLSPLATFHNVMNVATKLEGLFSNPVDFSKVYPLLRNASHDSLTSSDMISKYAFEDYRYYLAELREGDLLRFVLDDDANDYDEAFEKAFNNLSQSGGHLVQLNSEGVYVLNNFDGFSSSRFFLSDVQKQLKSLLGSNLVVAFPDDSAFFVGKMNSKSVKSIIKLMKENGDENKISEKIFKVESGKIVGEIPMSRYNFEVLN